MQTDWLLVVVFVGWSFVAARTFIHEPPRVRVPVHHVHGFNQKTFRQYTEFLDLPTFKIF
jgi:hypothetical protein